MVTEITIIPFKQPKAADTAFQLVRTPASALQSYHARYNIAAACARLRARRCRQCAVRITTFYLQVYMVAFYVIPGAGVHPVIPVVGLCR